MAIKKIYRNIQQEFLNPFFVRNKQKIFCIGRNKTGTTSLKKAMRDFGYITGNQRKAERLIQYYKTRNFKPIIEYCKTAQFFQDAPFSWPFTFIAMDVAFPGSKFILTVRDNPDQWYRSLTKFHGKRMAQESLPTKEDLQNDTYCYKGWAWEVNQMIYDVSEDEPYQKDILINHYEAHNAYVLDYFKYRSKDFLLLNVAEENSYYKLCKFLEQKPLYEKMPWENKT
jgi:hypothetical protein